MANHITRLLKALVNLGYKIQDAKKILIGIAKSDSLSKSSFLSSMTYDKDSKSLDLNFKRGSEYVYSNVSEREYLLLKNANSHGKEYNRRVREHPFTRIK